MCSGARLKASRVAVLTVRRAGAAQAKSFRGDEMPSWLLFTAGLFLFP